MQQFDTRRFLNALNPDVDDDYLAEDVIERDVEVQARTIEKRHTSIPYARITVSIPRDSCKRGPQTDTLQDTGHEVANAVKRALEKWDLNPNSYPPELSLDRIKNHRKEPEKRVFETEVQIPSKSAS